MRNLDEFWKKLIGPEILFKNILNTREIEPDNIIFLVCPDQFPLAAQEQVNKKEIIQTLSQDIM